MRTIEEDLDFRQSVIDFTLSALRDGSELDVYNLTDKALCKFHLSNNPKDIQLITKMVEFAITYHLELQASIREIERISKEREAKEKQKRYEAKLAKSQLTLEM